MGNFKVFIGDSNNQARYVGQLPSDETIAKLNNIQSFPTQSGNAGKFLTTNGSEVSWAVVDALPSQSGNSGKFLVTNGTTASWSTSLSVINNGSDISVPTIGGLMAVQVAVMPTASSTYEGQIYQFIGTTTANYIHGYFYKCTSNGAATPVYSWQQINVQPSADLSTKVDKTSSNNKIYATNGSGTQIVLDYSIGNEGATIAQRDSNGQLAVNQTPTANTHATSKKYVDDSLSGKQDSLVSGTNIKTINNTSILGSGDITIDSLPSQSGNSGKFLTTNGTNASWSGAPLVNKNTAAYGLKVSTLYDVSEGAAGANIFGYQATSSSTYSVVIGGQASISTNSTGSIAIGNSAQIGSNAAYAIQLGSGTNSTERTLKVGLGGTSYQYELLSADGTIPEARLANTTSAVAGQVLTLDSNGNASWADVDSLPSQTGNSGKYLTTNGTIASWVEISEYTSSEIETLWNSI